MTEANELTQMFAEKNNRLCIAYTECAQRDSANARKKGRSDARKLERMLTEDVEGPSYLAGGFV